MDEKERQEFDLEDIIQEFGGTPRREEPEETPEEKPAEEIPEEEPVEVPEELLEELREVALEAIERCGRKRVRDWTAIKSAIKNDLSGYLYKTTKRNPMILPIISEI